MKKIILFFALSLSLAIYAESQNGVVYVKPGGTGTGSSWDDALSDIQEAITVAKNDPLLRKDVWVAAGEFVIKTAININDSVNVYGSFDGTETSVDQRTKVEGGRAWEFAYPTILKGDSSRIIQSSGHLDMETIIDGFVMTDGVGIGSALNTSGGAAVCRYNVVYQNCIMRNNSAVGGNGGAIIMTGGIVRFCLIENNTQSGGSTGSGGIMSNPPAGYPSLISDCVIRGNISSVRAGGLGMQGVEMTVASNLEIYNNQAFDGTVFKAGGAIYTNSNNNRLLNCLIYNNSGASAVYYNGGSMYHCTIVKNVGGLYSAGNIVNLYNNVVWSCATDSSAVTATSITGAANSNATMHNNATYNPLPTDKGWNMASNVLLSSNLSNGDILEPAVGTLGSGPKFKHVTRYLGVAYTDDQKLQLDSADWSLNGNSPLVNIGENIELVKFDFEGRVRPQGYPVQTAQSDIGAYELAYHTVIAGEGEFSNGYIYSSLGEILPVDFSYGYLDGNLLELFFEAKSGYVIKRAYYTISKDGGVTFDGQEVDFTAEIDQDGLWSTLVNNSFKVTVEWDFPSALESNFNSLVYVSNYQNGIQITGLDKTSTIRLYTATGTMIKHVITQSAEIALPLEKGFYLLQINDIVRKILVK